MNYKWITNYTEDMEIVYEIPIMVVVLRHLIVIDENSTDVNKPVGMITPRDFTKYQEYTREEMRSIEKILEYYI